MANKRAMLMAKAEKLVRELTEVTPAPWVNIFEKNPPPKGWQGPVLNFSIYKKAEDNAS